MAALNMPTAFVGLGKVANSAFKNKNWRELLPLLVIELNTVYMWTCLGYLRIQEYGYYEEGSDYINSSSYFRQGANQHLPVHLAVPARTRTGGIKHFY